MDSHPAATRFDSLKDFARELIQKGAKGVLLTGSHARAEAHRYSDVDLIILGSGSSCLRLVDDCLVSESWSQPEQIEASLRRPELAVWMVPGLRQSVILEDPQGSATTLKKLAQDWNWDAELEAKADAWVAEEVTGYCEDARRLLQHVDTRSELGAGAMRSVFANRCAGIMAVRRRLLYVSENELWDQVAEEMGPRWRRLQSAAMSLEGESLKESASASLELFTMVIEDALELLSDRQRPVVESTLALMRQEPL